MKNFSAMKSIVFSLFFLFFTSSAPADEDVLTLGIIPYVSPGKLIKHNAVFSQYLEQKTGRKISILTAPNFNEFIQRTKNGEYDLIFTAPHHGRYAELHDGYQRIAMTRNNIQGYFLVSKDSPYQRIEDLRGKTLAVMPPTTILTQMTLAQLRQHGLKDSDYKIIRTSTHSNSIYSVLNHDSDAAVTGVKIWLRLNSKDKEQLRVLDTTEKVPGFMLMGNKTLSAETIKQLQTLLIRFDSTPEGQKYIFKGFQRIDDEDMSRMDKFIKVFD